jgi:hypothetical protein
VVALSPRETNEDPALKLYKITPFRVADADRTVDELVCVNVDMLAVEEDGRFTGTDTARSWVSVRG